MNISLNKNNWIVLDAFSDYKEQEFDLIPRLTILWYKKKDGYSNGYGLGLSWGMWAIMIAFMTVKKENRK